MLLNETVQNLSPSEKESLQTIKEKVMVHDYSFFANNFISIQEKDPYLILNYIQGAEKNKYNLLTRGLVIRISDGKITSMPFKRFGNFGEEFTAKIDFSKSEILEKLDGSMVGVSFKNHDLSEPIIHTRKMISTHDKNKISTGFDGEEVNLLDVAKKYIKKLNFNQNDTNFTWIFELIHKERPVVTKYKPEQVGVYLIGARDLNNLEEFTEDELDEAAKRLNVKRPRRFGIKNSHEEIAEMMNSFPNDFEGFVARQTDTGDRAKIKNKEYLILHRHLGDLNIKKLLQAWLDGEQDEVLAYFPNTKLTFDEIRKKFYKKLNIITEMAYHIPEHPNKKSFVTAVQKYDKQYQHFLFLAYGTKTKQELKDKIEKSIRSMSIYQLMDFLDIH